MAPKSRFIAARFTPEQQKKLILLSVVAGDPGNMSAGLRYAVDRIAASGELQGEVLPDGMQTEPQP